MKELKEFTVERLEYLASLPRKAVTIGGEEVAALAKIALAAEQTKPSFDEWLSSLGATIEVDCGCVTAEAFYHWIRVAYDAAPPHNHTEQDGWIKCSDRLPNIGQQVLATNRIINTFEVAIFYIGIVSGRSFFWASSGEYVATHWMPLPSRP